MLFFKACLFWLIIFGVNSIAQAQKKIPFDPAFTKKYAGIYHMAANGAAITNENDKYVLEETGKGTWTIFAQKKPDGSVSSTPLSITGKWRAGEGVIQLYFSARKRKRIAPQTFRLEGDVFRADVAYLKKMIISPPVQREPIIKK